MADRRRIKGTGSIYFSEARGEWVGRYELPRGPGGKRRRGVVYAKTAKACADELAEARRRWSPNREKQTVEQFLRWYCNEHMVALEAAGDVRPGTVRSYRQNLLGHVAPVIGHIRLDRLGPEDLTMLLAELGKGPLAAGTRALVYDQLGYALAVAERFERIGKNWRRVVKGPRRPRREARVLEVADAAALLEVSTGDRLGAWYPVALPLGMRVAEGVGLCWDDIDLDAGTMALTGQLVRRDGVWHKDPLKGRPRGEHRKIRRLPRFTVAALREHKRRQLEERLAWGPDYEQLPVVLVDGEPVGMDLVFRRPDGQPLWPDTIRRHVARMCKRAGIERRTPHDLRHSAASFLAARGVTLKVTMEILGWRSSKVALEVYTHALDEGHDAAAAAMDDLFGEQ